MLRNMKVITKLIIGFGIVIVLSVALSIIAIISLGNISTSYRYQQEYSEQRSHVMSTLKYNVMNLRRVTTAINAYSGNIERQKGYATETENICALIYAKMDEYTKLTVEDPILTAEQVKKLTTSTEIMRDTIVHYKKELVDVNIAYAMVDDHESLQANSAALGGLISAVQEELDRIDEIEQRLAATLETNVLGLANTYRTLFIIIAITITVISLSFAFLISSSIKSSITKPVEEMAVFLRQIDQTGDLSFPEKEWNKAKKMAAGKDEMSQTLAALLKILEQFIYYGKCLEQIAEHDLSREIQVIGDTDTCGMALVRVQETLNSVFASLNTASNRVAEGSKQISDGAQLLAQGSTEQSNTVLDLSVSISDIALKTKANADMAGRAAVLAGTIMHNAEKGSKQMEEMTDAVKEINQASQSISKVIKVIDDIAFQTNILALNAAVEAARAGRHGKGFAVVAEEVRNLAAKSAQAAKNTGGLIVNSIEKAKLGVRIAGETASSLAEIVSGINESNQLACDIAKSSEEQSIDIVQINNSINQVAYVVDQNSATAQQSAAISEEMNGQSIMLEELTSQFKLKDGDLLITCLHPGKLPESSTVNYR